MALNNGDVAEWLKAPHSKCGIRETVSEVQILPSPQSIIKLFSTPSRIFFTNIRQGEKINHYGIIFIVNGKYKFNS